MLGNPRASDILRQLDRLGRMNISVHAQVVIVPGMNDGLVLEQTVASLLNKWPTVQTLALVPVGVTRNCAPQVRGLTADEASDVLKLAEAVGPRVAEETSRTWLYPSDELYLLADREVPPAGYYDDPAQKENGVGLVRALLDDWTYTREDLPPRLFSGVSATLVCGTLIAPTLAKLAAEASQITGARLMVRPVRNSYFGDTVTVSGLLTGADVLSELKTMALSDVVCIPRAMLDEMGERTLDDMTTEALAQALGVPVEPVATMGDVIDLLYGLGA